MSYSMSLGMGHKQAQSLKQNQRLIMSPQMQQAIHLLQMSVMELSQAVEMELSENPVLEYSFDHETESSRQDVNDAVQEERLDKEAPPEVELNIDERDFEIMKRLDEDFKEHFLQSEGSFCQARSKEDEKLQSFLESSVTQEVSLFEHLMQQAKQVFSTELELSIAETLCGNFDERGFLDQSLEEIALLHDFEVEDVQDVLEEIQTFDPKGVGAKDLRESLLIQLRCMDKEGSLAYEIIDKHYDDLLHNRIPVIKKSLQAGASEIRDSIEKVIAQLDLQPGAWYCRAPVQAISADVSVSQRGDEWVVEVANEKVPKFRVNTRYLKMLDDPNLPEETREYVSQKIGSGKWLLKNIHQRNDTLYRIAEYLVDAQNEFFSRIDGQLKPLTMKTVAEALELHESTIARAVANKYVDCDRGCVSLRSFFTNAYVNEEGENISSRTVKDAVKEIIDNEDKSKPLSDEAISLLVRKKGVKCARRTVAKYRLELNIGNASQRRQYN